MFETHPHLLLYTLPKVLLILALSPCANFCWASPIPTPAPHATNLAPRPPARAALTPVSLEDTLAAVPYLDDLSFLTPPPLPTPPVARPGFLSWRDLLVKKPEISGLRGQKVKLEGFMYALDESDFQKHFILSAFPSDCGFCLPLGGAEGMVEVYSQKGIKFAFDLIAIEGNFEVPENDPTGVVWRIRDAVSTKTDPQK